MKLVKLSNVISMYPEPALGTLNEHTRYMALAVDKSTLNDKVKFGLARQITKSEGSVDVPGFLDKSKLIIVKSNDLLKWDKHEDLNIKGINKVIKDLSKKNTLFIGLEDPDIYTDEKGIKHIYFTIAFKVKDQHKYFIHLGHAHGKELNKLTATKPVIGPINKRICGFKEVSIPINVKETPRYHLMEMGYLENEEWVSTISSALAKEMHSPWKYKKIVLNPLEMKNNWCKGHLSPCCFLDDLNLKEDLLVCLVNGREPETFVMEKKVYGKFRPGFILFNTKTGEVPWIDSEHFLEDPDARTITFASDFIKINNNKGILYAHVNDGFVRAYEVDLKELEKYIRNKIKI